MQIEFYAKKNAIGNINDMISIASHNSNLIYCNLHYSIDYFNLSEEDFKLGSRESPIYAIILDIENGVKLFEGLLVFEGTFQGTKEYMINAVYLSIDGKFRLDLMWTNKEQYFFEIFHFNKNANEFRRVIPVNKSIWLNDNNNDGGQKMPYPKF
jgi:hypothetical protein